MEHTKQLKYGMELKFKSLELNDGIQLSDIRVYKITHTSTHKIGNRLAKILNKARLKAGSKLQQIQFNPDSKDWHIDYVN